MTDWINEVVVIEKVEKHPNADLLDIVIVRGDYPVIVRKGEYKVGDKACYISIGSIVPDTQQFYFLSPKAYEKYEEDGVIKQRQVGNRFELGFVPDKYRTITAKKILDIYSQGMLISLPLPDLNVGDSITDIVGLKKAPEDDDIIVGLKKTKGANAASPPVNFSIPYYDIKGLRSYISCLGEDEEIVLTEKIHGSNASFCFDEEKLWVKSHNYYKKMDEDDPWWDIAIRYELSDKLKKYPNLAFFGELYGMQKGFKYDCEIIKGALNSKIRFFDIYNVKTNRYLDYDLFTEIIKDADLLAAPLLYRGIWKGKDEMYQYADGPTTLGGKHTREGFVLRTTKERYEPRLHSRMCVKLIGESYNLLK